MLERQISGNALVSDQHIILAVEASDLLEIQLGENTVEDHNVVNTGITQQAVVTGTVVTDVQNLKRRVEVKTLQRIGNVPNLEGVEVVGNLDLLSLTVNDHGHVHPGLLQRGIVAEAGILSVTIAICNVEADSVILQGEHEARITTRAPVLVTNERGVAAGHIGIDPHGNREGVTVGLPILHSNITGREVCTAANIAGSVAKVTALSGHKAILDLVTNLMLERQESNNVVQLGILGSRSLGLGISLRLGLGISLGFGLGIGLGISLGIGLGFGGGYFFNLRRSLAVGSYCGIIRGITGCNRNDRSKHEGCNN